SHYGRRGGLDYMRTADASVFAIPQIEHVDAVNNLDEILAVPGLVTLVVGPNDLAGSLGYPGQPRHPEVLRAIDTVLAKGRAAGIPIGLGAGGEPDELAGWVRKGVNWLSIGADFWLLVRSISQLTTHIRAHAQQQ